MNQSTFQFAEIKKILILLFIILISGFSVNAQQNKEDPLGKGLLIFEEEKEWKNITLYKDSLCKDFFANLTLEETTCPTCMECAEPTNYYKGKIHPFICGGTNGMQFVCTGKLSQCSEIIVDNLGTKAYVLKGKGIFYTWNQYMQLRAKEGEYFTFNRQEDSTILYDKPYELNNLPKSNTNFQVNLNFKNVSDLCFYPVIVKDYWMKLKAVNLYTRLVTDKYGGTTIKTGIRKVAGYCWIIWRNDKDWLHGFTFNPF